MVGATREPVVRMMELGDEAATVALARRIAAVAHAGDVIALAGDLGTGKTRFARAFVDAAAGDGEEVPSPTFTLVQTYESPAGPIWHFDLYRLARPEEAYELGFEEALTDGIALIEWPERLGGLLPVERLDIALAYGDRPTARRARLAGHGGWAPRLAGLFPDG
ncbi:MAG: tRNA (adenosine(37)-N6)-threonylcarbamoyltransferase complex ATPase subunit type 1 TsaE [Dongiaceae bacterium]